MQTIESRSIAGRQAMLKLVLVAAAFASFLLSVYLYFLADDETAGGQRARRDEPLATAAIQNGVVELIAQTPQTSWPGTNGNGGVSGYVD